MSYKYAYIHILLLCGVVTPCYSGVDDKVPQLHTTYKNMTLGMYVCLLVTNYIYSLLLCGVMTPCYSGVDNKVLQLHKTKVLVFKLTFMQVAGVVFHIYC